MRRPLIDVFSETNILDLHGNAKKKGRGGALSFQYSTDRSMFRYTHRESLKFNPSDLMTENTYLVLGQYVEGSKYDDEVGRVYHFPRKYFNQLTCPNIEFIYFEPKRAG